MDMQSLLRSRISQSSKLHSSCEDAAELKIQFDKDSNPPLPSKKQNRWSPLRHPCRSCVTWSRYLLHLVFLYPPHPYLRARRSTTQSRSLHVCGQMWTVIAADNETLVKLHLSPNDTIVWSPQPTTVDVVHSNIIMADHVSLIPWSPLCTRS